MKNHQQAGFTLMEVMLVVVLMGLTAAAVTMSMGTSGPKQALERTAKQFIAATEAVLDDTVLSGRFMGIVINKQSYQFVYYEDGKWNPVVNDRLLAEKTLDDNVSLAVVLDGLPLEQEDPDRDSFSWTDDIARDTSEGSELGEPELTPQILLLPSGEMSAFELTLSAKTGQGELFSVLIVADALGRMTIGHPDETR